MDIIEEQLNRLGHGGLTVMGSTRQPRTLSDAQFSGRKNRKLSDFDSVPISISKTAEIIQILKSILVEHCR